MKKVLTYGVVIILLPVIIFFSIGLFVPTIDFESSVTVNKPLAQSFGVFNSPFSLSEWIPGLNNVRWLSGRPNVVGSKWEMTIEEGENEYILQEELVRSEEHMSEL